MYDYHREGGRKLRKTVKKRRKRANFCFVSQEKDNVEKSQEEKAKHVL